MGEGERKQQTHILMSLPADLSCSNLIEQSDCRDENLKRDASDFSLLDSLCGSGSGDGCVGW